MYVSSELPIKLGRICRFATPPRVCHAWLTLRVLFSGFGRRKTAEKQWEWRRLTRLWLVLSRGRLRLGGNAQGGGRTLGDETSGCGANLGESICMCVNLPQKEVPNF